jgi:plastocyanin
MRLDLRLVDPEQIYKEVLSEEQGKGSASGVAEGRAKAARQRAIQGSPHPKEPRWWPGSQPQFEGGDGAAPAEAPAAEAAPEPEPEEAPAAEAAPEPEPEEAPAAEEPAAEEPAAEEPAAEEPAAAPAAAAVAAPPAAAAAPAPQRTAGVTHGTDSGTRLRPEDAVGTDAQFDAQKALVERRRLIDELVATGVPAATAQGSGRPKAPLLLLAYILIPLIAIGILAASDDDQASAEGGGAEITQDGGGETGGLTTAVVAEGSKFDVETITLAAGEPASIELDNRDSGTQHNIAIYEDDTPSAGNVIFDGELITGPDTITYEFEALAQGEYYFQCDVHTDMNGAVVSE